MRENIRDEWVRETGKVVDTVSKASLLPCAEYGMRTSNGNSLLNRTDLLVYVVDGERSVFGVGG